MSNDKGFSRIPDAVIAKQRGPAMLRVVRSLFALFMSVGVLIAVAGFWAWSAFTSPGPLTENKIVELASGLSRTEIAKRLQDEGVISDSRVLSGASLVNSLRGASLKPGEYEFTAGSTMAEVLNTMASGRVLTYKLTVPEGWTSEIALARINENPVLTGDPVASVAEGSIMADTFVFRRGMTRAKLVQDMQDAQTHLLDDVWSKRPADFALKSKEEMLTLASIVERETAKAEERPRVAAVFLNRLKLGMRLQSDPTIIYGLVGGKAKLDRPLTRADIDGKTAYNTYQIDGLPPGPIASPGRAALEAVIAPAPTDDLFFVADGSGGHAFAATLEAHNANVKKWRELEKNGIELPGAENQTAAAPTAEVLQPGLPAPDAAAPETPAAPVDDAAIAEAETTQEQTQKVPAAAEDGTAQPTQAKPVAAAPPPLPVEKKIRDAVAPANSKVAEVAATPAKQVLEPGTVVTIGDKQVPIPIQKKKKK